MVLSAKYGPNRARVQEAVSILALSVLLRSATVGIQSSTNFLSLNVFLEGRSSPIATDKTINYKQPPAAPGTGSQVDENLVI